MQLTEEQSEAKEVAYLDSYKRNRYCKGQKANSGAYGENYEKIKWDESDVVNRGMAQFHCWNLGRRNA